MSKGKGIRHFKFYALPLCYIWIVTTINGVGAIVDRHLKNGIVVKYIQDTFNVMNAYTLQVGLEQYPKKNCGRI